jgi:hypothetical protein
MIKDNVLDDGIFYAMRSTARAASYYPLDRGDETSIYVSGCAQFFERRLNEVLEQEYGKFSTIISYFRKNSDVVDSHLRVHSDRDILGENPTHGVVFFLDVEEGGTGFYDHIEHGDRLPKGIAQSEEEYGDDSLWTFREYIEGKPNRIIGYPANKFHMRHPVVPSKERLIWVSFIQQLER